MKVGDLVTLSSYGTKLDSLFMFADDYRVRFHDDTRPLIGMVIKTTTPESVRLGYSYYSAGSSPASPTTLRARIPAVL